MSTRQTITLDKINRCHAERLAAESHLMYEVRRAQRAGIPGQTAANDLGSGRSPSSRRAPLPSGPTTTAVSPTSDVLDGYIAKAEALVRPSGEIEPGAEGAALALLCSIVAARRTVEPVSH